MCVPVFLRFLESFCWICFLGLAGLLVDVLGDGLLGAGFSSVVIFSNSPIPARKDRWFILTKITKINDSSSPCGLFSVKSMLFMPVWFNHLKY